MHTYHALRHFKGPDHLKSGDVLVLFGELFNRGYANGLVDEAQKRGLKVITTTVGRRDKDGRLRPLNEEEIAQQKISPFINVPLEAGFDLEPDDNGLTVVDHLKEVKLSDWESFKFPPASLESSRKIGQARFSQNVREYLHQLRAHIPAGANVLFAHLMAGGVPRAKIIMPLMNRVVKGTGDRFLSSERLSKSSIGQLILESFYEVTAQTYATLIQESTPLRTELEKQGAHVSYLAYGYHGTEVLIGHDYVWQTYSPYIQGWAKIRLENLSREWSKKGVHTCVYNCPEILTNSSSIFSGVELSLYNLLGALRKEGPGSAKCLALLDACQELLKPGIKIDDILGFTKSYLMSELIRSHCVFDRWPQHNSKDQLEKMLDASDQLINMHMDPKNLITFLLSEVVFEACGKIMLADSFRPEAPVAWINHDIIAKLTAND